MTYQKNSVLTADHNNYTGLFYKAGGELRVRVSWDTDGNPLNPQDSHDMPLTASSLTAQQRSDFTAALIIILNDSLAAKEYNDIP